MQWPDHEQELLHFTFLSVVKKEKNLLVEGHAVFTPVTVGVVAQERTPLLGLLRAPFGAPWIVLEGREGKGSAMSRRGGGGVYLPMALLARIKPTPCPAWLRCHSPL